MPHLSSSQLDTYINCPAKWHAQYVEKTKAEVSEALVFGGEIHKVFEEFGLQRMQTKRDTVDPEHMKFTFRTNLAKALDEQDPKGILRHRVQDMMLRGEATIDAFCRDIAPSYWPIEVENPEGINFEIPKVAPGINPDTGELEPWTFVGRIDARTVPLHGDGITIVDWKTGKEWRDGAEHSKTQATAYLLSDLMMGRPVSTQVTFITFPLRYIAEQKRYVCEADIRPTTRTLKQVGEYLQLLRQTATEINEIRAGTREAFKKPNFLCPWCPKFERDCYEGQLFQFNRGKLPVITAPKPDYVRAQEEAEEPIAQPPIALVKPESDPDPEPTRKPARSRKSKKESA